MECTDAVSDEPRYVICAVARNGENYVFTPFGPFADGNPHEAYVPPSMDRPLHELRITGSGPGRFTQPPEERESSARTD